MRFFHNLPIQRKLVLVTLGTCGVALALACTALFWFQSVNFRRGFAAELESIGAVIAQNSSAPLTFEDMRAAAEVLSALKVKPHITSARLLDKEGKVFAHFGENGSRPTVPAPVFADQVTFGDGFASLSVAVEDNGARLGTLQLRAQYDVQYRELLSLYGVVVAAVVAGSLLIILLLSTLMQKLIAGPITVLAGVAHAIAEKQDYSVRAPAAGRDEVGLLTSTFNGMLDRIQARETALEHARVALARQFESLQEKNLMMENAVEGIAILDDKGRYISVNPAYVAMLGRTPEELIGQEPTANIHPEDLSRATAAVAQMQREGKVTIELRGQRKGGSSFYKEVTLIRHLGAEGQFLGHYRFMKDITARKEAEAELARLNHELHNTARQAGMAEIATGVLHNVGNVLNSVNTSAMLVIQGLRKSEVPNLARAVGLMRTNMDHLGEFLTKDPKGKQLLAFLEALAEQLAKEQTTFTQEMQGLQQNLDHIKQIVAMQQAYAKVSGVLEKVPMDALIEDALRLSANSLVRHQVEVVREFEAVPPVITDRHKVLQILINLISNARQALDSRPEGRRLLLRIARASDEHVKLEVTDNGVGIPEENLTRIFNHGFTTKETGHGFGLHSGANAARELGGSLTARSAGSGQGATFILELPLIQPKTLSQAA